MSILATLNVDSGVWTVDAQPESPAPVLEIGFTSESSPTVFDGLTFGYDVTVNSQTHETKTYPPEGVTYISTDQTYLSTDTIYLAADDDVTITVNASNAGQTHTTDITFTVPRPAQPYPSWTWIDGAWTPPTPYPDDDALYVWDEQTQDWIPYIEED